MTKNDKKLEDVVVFSGQYEDNADNARIVIPEGIRELCVNLIYCTNIESLVIGADVEHITVEHNCYNGKYSVYYLRTKDNKPAIDIQMPDESWKPFDNQFSGDSEHYYYSEAAPTEAGNFWHYVDGVPTPW